MDESSSLHQPNEDALAYPIRRSSPEDSDPVDGLTIGRLSGRGIVCDHTQTPVYGKDSAYWVMGCKVVQRNGGDGHFGLV